MAEWILRTVESYGYAGIVALMLLENIFPPVPSELIMPFAGFAAARGQLHPVGVVLAGMLGSILGTLPWYLAGRKLGAAGLKRFAARHGQLLTLDAAGIDKAQGWFDRHGHASVLVGRLVPAVRTFISMPAGISRMHPATFLLWSAAGTLVWTGLLAGLGYALESHYERIKEAVEWATRGVVAFLVLGYLYRVAKWRRDA